MKKTSIIIFSILFLFLQSSVMADDEDWSNVFDSYEEAEYGKIISEKDVNKAVNDIQNLQKKKKKKKSKKQNIENIEEKKPNEPVVIFEVPSRSEPLFTLVTDVSYKGQVIPQGFYLVSAINKNNKYFIRLTRGEGRIIADIEANVTKGKISGNKIFSEIMKNDILKLTYTENDMILEAYLWIQ